MPIHRLTIVGTGLIGSSVGLALHAQAFAGRISGWDRNPKQLQIAQQSGAIDEAAGAAESDALAAAVASDVILLSGPVLSILDWMEKLSGRLQPGQLVTDVGSVKRVVVERAASLFGGPGQAGFLPGHPMAGKESAGAAEAEATLFENAAWLFTPFAEHPLAEEWRSWVRRFGARTMMLEAVRHDEICAWVSHLPQMLATGLSALLEEQFGKALENPARGDAGSIGGRALREMTRLGASPYSMWRDIAMTNADEIAATLLALEQKLAHIRENLKTPALRDEFASANRFRLPR